MTTIGAFEAKTKLSELLDRVEQGEEIVITRHGKPSARLVPHLLPLQNDIDFKKAREIAESFRAKVPGSFSSREINAVLYDEDGLPK